MKFTQLYIAVNLNTDGQNVYLFIFEHAKIMTPRRRSGDKEEWPLSYLKGF